MQFFSEEIKINSLGFILASDQNSLLDNVSIWRTVVQNQWKIFREQPLFVLIT